MIFIFIVKKLTYSRKSIHWIEILIEFELYLSVKRFWIIPDDCFCPAGKLQYQYELAYAAAHTQLIE
jgi:hypothetical protein